MTTTLLHDRRLHLLVSLVILLVLMAFLFVLTHGQIAHQVHSVAQSSPPPNIMYGN